MHARVAPGVNTDDPPVKPPLLPPFDPQDMRTEASFAARLFDFALQQPRLLWWGAPLLGLLLRLKFGMHLLRRYDDVREVLQHDREFPVPWKGRMTQLTFGTNFVLGMANDAAYKAAYRQLAEAFRMEDIERCVTGPSYTAARQIVEAKRLAVAHDARGMAVPHPPFDAVEALVMSVPSRICASYLGIDVGNEVLFAQRTLALSAYVFAIDGWDGMDPKAADNPEARRTTRNGVAAARELSVAIMASIARAKSAGGSDAVAMDRLIQIQKREKIPDPVLHAHLFGMVLGFIPTNVLAGGNMLETLLRRETFMARARQAACDDDDALLWRCLRETLRFRHINLGPPRGCNAEYVLNRGGRSEKRFAPGSFVMPSTQLAMFDPSRIERPYSFDPLRDEDNYLVFGVGQHWCIGAYIAEAQITQTFKALLVAGRISAAEGDAGRMRRYNSFYPMSLGIQVRP